MCAHLSGNEACKSTSVHVHSAYPCVCVCEREKDDLITKQAQHKRFCPLPDPT